MGSLPTIDDINAEFELGTLSGIDLVHSCLERIQDPNGEGSRAFIEVSSVSARKTATFLYHLRSAGTNVSPLMGMPISVKDLFDVKGQVTRAGSKVLADASPAAANATVVHRLQQAGAIIIGRTNMTEFAYSGVGLNPHYGTPSTPYDRKARRIPGGSSSGAGVSIADRMAVAAIGTDTGGSVRIPAALCGITGYKPTARRIPTEGAFPLSQSFDSVGPMAPSVSCCITMEQIMRGAPVKKLTPLPLKHLRFAVPDGLPMEGLDTHVTEAFESAIAILHKAGAHLDNVRINAIEQSDRVASGARLLSSEAYAIHRHDLESKPDLYDPRVSTRMLPAAAITAAEYIDLLAWRKHFIQKITGELEYYDALLMPTTPTIAPLIKDLEADDTVYFSANTLMLRNTSIINQMDGCALSIPCHLPGDPPVGLMLACLGMNDERLLRTGLAVEEALTSRLK